jgi:transposase-like protein
MKDLKTLSDAIDWFSVPEHCLEAVEQMRWPDGKIPCPVCSYKDHNWLRNQNCWQCKSCGKQFSVKLGTVFEASQISLEKWLLAIWLVANSENGIGTYEIAKNIGVTMRSARFVLKRISLALG